MSKVSDFHNATAGRMVAEIIKGTIAAEGDEKSIMVLLESIVAGVITTIIREEHDGDTMALLDAGSGTQDHHSGRRRSPARFGCGG